MEGNTPINIDGAIALLIIIALLGFIALLIDYSDTKNEVKILREKLGKEPDYKVRRLDIHDYIQRGKSFAFALIKRP
jgi:hypothetical protein